MDHRVPAMGAKDARPEPDGIATTILPPTAVGAIMDMARCS